MVLKILGAALSVLLPSGYFVHIIVSIVAILVVHAFAQGRTTTRERDLHSRVILVTVSYVLVCVLYPRLNDRSHREDSHLWASL